MLHIDILRRTHIFLPSLDVPGLAEKRPSVLVGMRLDFPHQIVSLTYSAVGDIVHVHLHGSPRGLFFEGWVHTVHQSEIGLKFNEKFAPKPTDCFYVEFILNRSSLRRQHQALDSKFARERVLFPGPEHLGSDSIPQGISCRTFNPAIATNPRQLQAVCSIVCAPAGSVPFVLFGP